MVEVSTALNQTSTLSWRLTSSTAAVSSIPTFNHHVFQLTAVGKEGNLSSLSFNFLDSSSVLFSDFANRLKILLMSDELSLPDDVELEDEDEGGGDGGSPPARLEGLGLFLLFFPLPSSFSLSSL